MNTYQAIETYIDRQPDPDLYRRVYKKLKAYHQEGDPMAIFIFARHCARKNKEDEDIFADIAKDIENGIRRMTNEARPQFAKAKLFFASISSPVLTGNL